MKHTVTFENNFKLLSLSRIFDLRQMNFTACVLQNNDTYLQNYTEKYMLLF